MSSAAPAAARPKSIRRTLPAPSSITFAGFRSRCKTPRWCAAARPAQSCRAMSVALSSGNRPMRLSDVARSSPSTNSIDRKMCPSTSPMSCTRQMFGWDTCRAVRTSLWNWASLIGSCPTLSGRNFSATGWPSRRSSARYTSPIPPRPISPMTRYRPSSTVPGEKRPWLMESDDDSQPPELGGLRPDAGAVRVMPCSTPFGSTTRDEGSSAGGEPASRDVPQCGQKRALSGVWAPQRRHSIGRFYGTCRGCKKAVQEYKPISQVVAAHAEDASSAIERVKRLTCSRCPSDVAA